MDEDGRVGVKGFCKIDWLSNLPEPLLCKVLLTLPTKDVVRTSVLSKRWKNLWRYVPGLDLDDCVFPDHIIFVSFVDASLGFNSESYLESFKLKYYWCDGNRTNGDPGYHPGNGIIARWIKTLVDRRVKHIVVEDHTLDWDTWNLEMPPTLYTCESLVSLKLNGVKLASPLSVSLPCLKFMDLTLVHFANALDLEKLISGCPVLESLHLEKSLSDGIDVLRVYSQSLVRFTHVYENMEGLLVEEDFVVAINAPRLQYLRLGDDRIESFILKNTSSLVEAYIDSVFKWSFRNKLDNYLLKRKMISSFLKGVSCVKDMTITSKTLEVIYHYAKFEQLPLFPNLSLLRVTFTNYRWKMLPIFLESCPNLKSLVVAFTKYPIFEGISMLSEPSCCLPSSLEYVDIERPLNGEAMEMKLLSYFLGNSATLKRLTVRLDASLKVEKSVAIFNELLAILAIPRLSSSCQVVFL